MFLGTYTPRLDDKGRLFLPAKLRDQLERRVVMAKGQERCLYVLPVDEFQRMAAASAAAPVTDKAAREYGRVLFSGASDEEIDGQGRISIPPKLREYAGLSRDVTVVGAYSRIEIWDTAAWESWLATQESAYADVDAPGPAGPARPAAT